MSENAQGGDAIVLEIIDNDSEAIKFYFALLSGVVFPSLDGSLHESNGWNRVRMTERQWQSFYGKYCRKNRLGLDGSPAPLNADGTIKGLT
jgi:hypothetical protein